jgi:methionine sulfoxide reductase heme-binding subunit
MKAYMITGYVLLAAFIIQELADLRWPFLQDLQQVQYYRKWSGFGLILVIAFQWILTFVRAGSNNSIPRTLTQIHKWLGAFSPLLFYIHSMKLGYAYLFLLSITFFSNTVLGYTNLELIRNQPRWVYQGWMIAHVGFSLFISVLALYHVWIVFWYE